MPANKRDKASDVFNSTDYAFCSKVSFSEAFPQIKNIRVEVEEDGEGVYELSKNRFIQKKIWVNLLIAVIHDAIMAVLTLVLLYEIWLKANVLNLKPIEGAKVMKALQKKEKVWSLL